MYIWSWFYGLRGPFLPLISYVYNIFWYQKPLPPIPADQPVTPIERLSPPLPPQPPLINPPYDVNFVSFFAQTSDRYMIFVETNLEHKSGWIFHVRGPSETKLVYKSKKSERPVFVSPHHAYQEYIGTASRDNYARMDAVLRTIPAVSFHVGSKTYQDDWEWAQKAVQALVAHGVLKRETDEKKDEPPKLPKLPLRGSCP